ncbi:aminomethyltransferase family protein [Paraliomyxa miuraensis]|uniref:aminomethyltransferase family protein n=1 Tax=Paraliomyxa miuraensis TaxID=376150 RepID=UPI002256098A|nr:aminomethyltransferase family protein [Paraliomyxa miuraensis]MCX4239697.1 aminomethyltransferase family protein [Paraliomyxa miuraensis]
MPIPTPFHPRTAALCTSMFWKEWAGYHAVRSYDVSHEREYFALRNGAGVLDVSPLHKYELRGPGAADLLSRITVRDIRKLRVGRVTYLCWCNDDGKILDDGTVSRLDDQHFRLTAAEPTFAWLHRFTGPHDVTIEDSSERLAALAIQGPTSRDALARICDAPLHRLPFFGVTRARLQEVDVWISRTGYTGDLGYEIWVDREHALTVWDAIMAVGLDHRVLPLGLDALDVARIEAGFIMNGVDYWGAHHCLVPSRQSTPYELGLGWTVNLDREPFVGQAALRAERARGPAWATVGLRYDWDEYEALFARFGLPPHVPLAAWRDGVPVYGSDGRQVGRATSGAWSPLLKANLALASVRPEHAALGTRLRIEVTVEYERHQISAIVSKTPFFNPERKRSA